MQNNVNRLREREKAINEAMKRRYAAAMKLKEIRDDELYKDDGFDTWSRYCRERWDWSQDYTDKLIRLAEYYDVLPPLPPRGGT
jgi:hypothetical protein